MRCKSKHTTFHDSLPCGGSITVAWVASSTTGCSCPSSRLRLRKRRPAPLCKTPQSYAGATCCFCLLEQTLTWIIGGTGSFGNDVASTDDTDAKLDWTDAASTEFLKRLASFGLLILSFIRRLPRSYALATPKSRAAMIRTGGKFLECLDLIRDVKQLLPRKTKDRWWYQWRHFTHRESILLFQAPAKSSTRRRLPQRDLKFRLFGLHSFTQLAVARNRRVSWNCWGPDEHLTIVIRSCILAWVDSQGNHRPAHTLVGHLRFHDIEAEIVGAHIQRYGLSSTGRRM